MLFSLYQLFNLNVDNNIIFCQLSPLKTRYCLSIRMETEVVTEKLMGMEDLAHVRLQHRQLNHHAYHEFLPMHRCFLQLSYVPADIRVSGFSTMARNACASRHASKQ
jgi:hypothetical protein